MKKNKRYTGIGIFIGLIVGALFDLVIAIKYNYGCQSSQLQEFLGIHPLCVKMYALGIWFAIIGGIIGYSVKTNSNSNDIK